jgi:hypothetical protein
MRNLCLCSVTAAAILAGCAPTPSKDDDATMAHVDHVIVGTSDLESGMDELQRLTGVRPIVGGAHPGQGTRNALLSLGDRTYLELYAPNPAEPVGSPEVRELQGLAGLKPFGWAIAPDNIEAMRSALAQRGFQLSLPESGSRARPDGSVLKWETFGIERFDDKLAPFFIRWKQPADLHPSRTSPGGCRLVAIHLQAPRPERLADAIRPLRLDVRVVKAREPRMEVKLACPKGVVTLQ